jgi:hypothetical protein
MARSLKIFTTSAGFFDLAVAAPSMKAALEAWGSERNCGGPKSDAHVTKALVSIP